MKHNLTRATERELNKIADSLPKVPQKTAIPTVISGSNILSHNPKARLKTGDVVKSGNLYTVETKKPKNNRRFLRKIYEQYGMDGVNKTVEHVKQQATTTTAQ